MRTSHWLSDSVFTLALEMRAKTLKAFARSHGIKLGKNKTETLNNILDATDKLEIRSSAVPGGDLSVHVIASVPRRLTQE